MAEPEKQDDDIFILSLKQLIRVRTAFLRLRLRLRLSSSAWMKQLSDCDSTPQQAMLIRDIPSCAVFKLRKSLLLITSYTLLELRQYHGP